MTLAAGLFLLLVVYCTIDPFNQSAISGFPDFETVRVNVPAWSQVPVERDHENLLQKSEINFLNQAQGPESVVFDPMGRGPYTILGNYLQLSFSGDDSGRVLKYDPNTKQTSVLVRNLQFPNGVSLSRDGSFFVFCEGSIGRLTKYWLKGEKAGSWEVMAVLPGFPDNVRTNENGEFWVAISCRRTMYGYLFDRYPKLRILLLKLPVSAKLHGLMKIGGHLHAMAVKYSPEGKLLQILEDREGKVVKALRTCSFTAYQVQN
ncbi:hypothetical protein ACS0TY_020092 [Phlomoides rotata]